MPNANQEMYDRHGADYHAKRSREDDSSWNRYLDQPMIEKLLEGVTPGQVADLGCGSGLLTRWLADHGHDAVGADFSESLIGIARTENPSLDFAVANLKSTPFDAARFHLITCALVLHYEPDLRPCFAEFARLLKPSGRAVFTMHHPVDEVSHSHPTEPGVRVLEPYFHNEPYYFEMAGMQLTAYHHTFEDITEALADNGFVIERLVEARMPDSVRDRFPRYHARTNTYPTFVGFRARLDESMR